MGQRANLIVTHQKTTEVFYTHWRANTLPRDLFWGPQYATAFARSQKKVTADEPLDEVWAEGGAVIDIDRQFLLLFGGEDLAYDVPMRRLFLRLLKNTWSQWDVRWAYEGVCDLADYLRIPRSDVLVHQEPSPAVPLELAEPLRDAATIASFKLLRGPVALFPSWGYVQDLLSAGPSLLEANRTGGVAEMKWDGDLPISGGFHVDEAQQSLEIWTASDAPSIAERTSAHWPGWSVRWYKDFFEFQIERTGGCFNVAVPTEDQLLSRIRASLLYEESEGAVERFLQITDAIAKEGQEITSVNPLALRDARLTLSMDLRVELIDRAIASL